jgi:hypothetical protein
LGRVGFVVVRFRILHVVFFFFNETKRRFCFHTNFFEHREMSAAVPTSTNTTEALKARVIAHIGISEEEFQRLPKNIVFGIATEMGISIKDQALLYLALPPEQTESSSLKDYFFEQERRNLERWRVTLAKQRTQRESQLARSLNDLQDLFVDLVKNRALDAHDCFVLSHLLYGKEEDRLHLASTIVAHPTSERDRYTSTNLLRAEMTFTSAFLQAHGDTLLSLPIPLLPDKRLQAINQQNFALHNAAPQSGGDDNDDFPTSFKREPSGGGALPIITMPDGQQALNTTDLEIALQHISNQVRNLRYSNNNNNNNNRGRQSEVDVAVVERRSFNNDLHLS